MVCCGMLCYVSDGNGMEIGMEMEMVIVIVIRAEGRDGWKVHDVNKSNERGLFDETL